MDNLIGKRLDGRYSIEGLVGVGGMANVYRGTDLKTGNRIAVKVLTSPRLSPSSVIPISSRSMMCLSPINCSTSSWSMWTASR